MTSNNSGTGTAFRIHNCSFAAVCPACLHKEPCPPLIVLAVLGQEAHLFAPIKRNEPDAEHVLLGIIAPY